MMYLIIAKQNKPKKQWIEHMSCKKVRKLLIPWLDGELSSEQNTQVQAWWDNCKQSRQCSRCHKEIAAYQIMQKALRSLPEQEFPAWLHHRIMDKVHSPIIAKQMHRRRLWQTIPIAAAIMLSLYLGSVVSLKTFYRNNNSNTKTETEFYSYGEYSLLAVLEDNGGHK